MKNRIKLTLIFITNIVGLSFGQVRQDINSLTQVDQTILFDAMCDYITPQIIEQHCNFNTSFTNGTPTFPSPGNNIHSDFDFLPMHRVYLEGIEDYLIEKGLGQFVPLPYWQPTTTIITGYDQQTSTLIYGYGGGGPVPQIFQNGTSTNPGAVDSDCFNVTCTNIGVNTSCLDPSNFNPLVLSANPIDLGANFANYPNGCNQQITNATQLAPLIKFPHNLIHGAMGESMANFKSPSTPIFWLWHAYCDDIWKSWECTCPESTTLPIDLYMKDNSKVIESIRDRGEEPNTDPARYQSSDDIWVRKQNDGLSNHTHQNAEYNGNSNTSNYIYVQVRNRGCEISSGNDVLKVYWARKRLLMTWPNSWNQSNINGNVLGSLVGTLPIPQIVAQGSTILEFPWSPPASLNGSYPRSHYLIARIESIDDPMTFQETPSYMTNVMNNNNITFKPIKVRNDLEDGISPGDDTESLLINLSPNPVEHGLTISYKTNGVLDAHLIIVSPFGISSKYNLDVRQTEITIDLSSFSTGIYNVLLVCNDIIVDNSTIVKE